MIFISLYQNFSCQPPQNSCIPTNTCNLKLQNFCYTNYYFLAKHFFSTHANFMNFSKVVKMGEIYILLEIFFFFANPMILMLRMGKKIFFPMPSTKMVHCTYNSVNPRLGQVFCLIDFVYVYLFVLNCKDF